MAPRPYQGVNRARKTIELEGYSPQTINAVEVLLTRACFEKGIHPAYLSTEEAYEWMDALRDKWLRQDSVDEYFEEDDDELRT